VAWNTALAAVDLASRPVPDPSKVPDANPLCARGRAAAQPSCWLWMWRWPGMRAKS